MKRIVVAIPHSHGWLMSQNCFAALKRNPPVAGGFEVEIICIDNSATWSPSWRGLCETRLGEGVTYVPNRKGNPFHASALDQVIDDFEFDYLMAMETDVLALRPDWLQWFVNQIGDNYAVGHWHHEQFVNPSCTFYRGDVLREFNAVCKANTDDIARWGDNFQLTKELDPGSSEWIAGAFAEKRGWPEGTVLKERPTGQSKGPGWYEPGQALHHWAVDKGYGYKVCDTATTERTAGLPTQTFYGLTTPFENDLQPGELWDSGGYTVHLWGGTRSLDIIKHGIEWDEFNKVNVKFWQEREARFWLQIVPPDVQAETIALIHQYGWHTKGLGTPDITDRDREAARTVEQNYRNVGMPI